MSFPDFNSSNPDALWERFQELLWFDDKLEMWLDISRTKISYQDLTSLEAPFQKAFQAIEKLESGEVANLDENRLVGHYWLRNSQLAPSNEITELIENEIESVQNFGQQILKGKIVSSSGAKFTDVFWIGIGGSGLGPLLLIEALKQDFLGLSFHFLDNVDPVGIHQKLQSIKATLDTTLFVTVSKSGGTPEPLIGMEQARHFLESFGGNWQSQAVAITMKNSPLDSQAKSESWLKIFDMPDWVGGRTSITSVVGLLPISLLGKDLQGFLRGALLMDKSTRNTDLVANPAALLAASWWVCGDGKGKRDMVVLPYRDRLEVFSRYLQQLVMESLGKKLDRDGNSVFQGLSVFGNKGSTDQHAYVQQLRDGLDNFFVTFIEELQDSKEIKTLNGRNPGDYLSGFYQGTRAALTQADKQSITITLMKFDEIRLGALIALFERAVSLYAELININAYHQPGVEAGKKAATNVLLCQESLIALLDDNEPRSIRQLQALIPESNFETIYLIIRHKLANDFNYSMNGSWGDPDSLLIRKL